MGKADTLAQPWRETSRLPCSSRLRDQGEQIDQGESRPGRADRPGREQTRERADQGQGYGKAMAGEQPGTLAICHVCSPEHRDRGEREAAVSPVY